MSIEESISAKGKENNLTSESRGVGEIQDTSMSIIRRTIESVRWVFSYLLNGVSRESDRAGELEKSPSSALEESPLSAKSLFQNKLIDLLNKKLLQRGLIPGLLQDFVNAKGNREEFCKLIRSRVGEPLPYEETYQLTVHPASFDDGSHQEKALFFKEAYYIFQAFEGITESEYQKEESFSKAIGKLKRSYDSFASQYAYLVIQLYYDAIKNDEQDCEKYFLQGLEKMKENYSIVFLGFEDGLEEQIKALVKKHLPIKKSPPTTTPNRSLTDYYLPPSSQPSSRKRTRVLKHPC